MYHIVPRDFSRAKGCSETLTAPPYISLFPLFLAFVFLFDIPEDELECLFYLFFVLSV